MKFINQNKLCKFIVTSSFGLQEVLQGEMGCSLEAIGPVANMLSLTLC